MIGRWLHRLGFHWHLTTTTDRGVRVRTCGCPAERRDG